MKLFIWQYIEDLTNNYHSGGGLVVVAESLEAAKKLNYAVKDKAPDKTFDLVGEVQEEQFVFPDVGCC